MQYPKAIVNLAAIINNIRTIKKLAQESKVLAIVKANAYGHGLIQVTSVIREYVDGFGVARIDEATKLRESGIKNKILLLEGFVGSIELFKLNELKLDTVVHCFEQLELIEKHQQDLTNLHIWIKQNTGMNRLGFDKDEAIEVEKRLQKLGCVDKIHYMTHLARAENLNENNFTKQQLENFNSIYKDRQDRSIVASSGILYHHDAALHWIRPGIIMYGISPGNNDIKEKGFINALTLETILISVHKRKAGDSIGYGNNYTLDHDTYVGVVAMGYGDGYLRDAKVNTPVLVNGRRVPLIGKVSMDMLTVDLGPEKIDKVGDKVILFGNGLPVEEVAAHNGIINYELTTRLTERVRHEYLYSLDDQED